VIFLTYTFNSLGNLDIVEPLGIEPKSRIDYGKSLSQLAPLSFDSQSCRTPVGP